MLLKNFIRVYVPTHDRDGKSLTPEQVFEAVQRVERDLCERFGGCTTVNGHGAWVNPMGDIIHEPVAIVESYHSVSYDDTVGFRYALACYLSEYLKQDGVAMVCEEGLLLYDF